MHNNVIHINTAHKQSTTHNLSELTQSISHNTNTNVDDKIYDIIIRASGVSDFNDNMEFYLWYASDYCFKYPCERRIFDVEKKLRTSDPSVQLPY